MAIQTIGGAAASTGVQGTPVLKLQRGTSTAAGIVLTYGESVMEYTLSTPLPAGNYFFTFTSSGSTNQFAAVLDDGTLLTSAATNSVVSTSAAVPAGRTLSKITFRQPVDGSWASVLSLDVLVSTDTAGFYGLTVPNTSSLFTGPSLSLPSLPAGIYPVTSSWIHSANIDSSNRMYFVAHNRTTQTLSASTSNPGTSLNNNGDATTLVQNFLKFYEWNVTTGVLTEKAVPQFSNTVTIGVGWNPQSNPGGSTYSASISHLQDAFIANAKDYVYFCPGYASLFAVSNSSTYRYGHYQYQNMGVYNKSANTWQLRSGIRSALSGIKSQYSFAVAGNDLLITPTINYQTNYVGNETIDLYDYSWMTSAWSQSTLHHVYSLNQWYSSSSGRTTSSGNLKSVGTPTPATDLYVFADPLGDPISAGADVNYQWYLYSVAARAYVQRRYSGLYLDVNQSGYSLAPMHFQTIAWFKDPTSTSHLFINPSGQRTFYRVDVDSYGAASTSSWINWYMTATKWKSANANPSSSSYGWVLYTSPERLIQYWSAAQPNGNNGATKTNTSFSARQLIGYPDYFSSSF